MRSKTTNTGNPEAGLTIRFTRDCAVPGRGFAKGEVVNDLREDEACRLIALGNAEEVGVESQASLPADEVRPA